MKGKTIIVGFTFGFLLNFFIFLYFIYILLTDGDIEVNQDQRRIALSAFLLVMGV